MMKDKKINKRVLIIVLLLVITVVSGTFAWFTFRSKESALVLSIGDINDSKVIVKPYQIKETMVPVNTYTSGVYSQVQVNNNNSSQILLNLYYRINQLDETLINNGLKYTIASSSTLNGTYTEVNTGNFTTVTDNELVVLNTEIGGNTTLYYRIYLWIDSSIGNQNTIQDLVLDVELNGNVSVIEPLAPVLDNGMIPVTISEDGVATTVAEDDSSWYNYDNKEWANVVLVKESGTQTRSYYKNNAGKIVAEADILAYYVWIPRYKYAFPKADGNPEEISIVFESADAEISTGTATGTSYYTHPAFIWDGKPVSGIWVGKFEITGNATTPTILPNKQALRNQNVGTQFTTSLKFAGGTQSGSTVTFAGNNTYGLTSVADSHMMKNSEWGAVAYLSHSEYGINQNIYINNSSDYYTGRSGGNVAGSVDTVATHYSGQTATNTYISNGYYTWIGQEIDSSGTIGSYASDRTLGTNASTTGNVTGVYDMSGGSFEYVMGNYGNTIGTSGFTTLPNIKYYDLYSSTQFTGDSMVDVKLCTLETCGGHALSEISGWYRVRFDFVQSNFPFFRRGGCYSSTDGSQFWMQGFNSNALPLNSFRSVVVVQRASIQ